MARTKVVKLIVKEFLDGPAQGQRGEVPAPPWDGDVWRHVEGTGYCLYRHDATGMRFKGAICADQKAMADYLVHGDYTDPMVHADLEEPTPRYAIFERDGTEARPQPSRERPLDN